MARAAAADTPCRHVRHPQPDGVQRGLVGEVIKRFEQRGYTLKGLKLLNVERSLAEKHYADLSSKPFFPALVDYICSGPVVAMVRRVPARRRRLLLLLVAALA